MEEQQVKKSGTIDWANMNFKGKDILQIICYTVITAFYFSSMSNKIDRYNDQFTLFQRQYEVDKSDKKDNNKSFEITLQNMQAQINLLTQQVALNKQDVEYLKSIK